MGDKPGIIADLSGEEIVEVYKLAERMELAPELIVNLLISLLRDINIYQQTRKEELLFCPVVLSWPTP